MSDTAQMLRASHNMTAAANDNLRAANLMNETAHMLQTMLADFMTAFTQQVDRLDQIQNAEHGWRKHD